MLPWRVADTDNCAPHNRFGYAGPEARARIVTATYTVACNAKGDPGNE